MSAARLLFRQLTFEEYDDPPQTSQSEAFLRVQEGSYAKHPEQALLLERTALRLAAENGAEGFTSDEVLDEAGGREHFPKNLIGVVIGRLRSIHAIVTVRWEKGLSPLGKSRWIRRWRLNGGALKVGP